MVIKFQQRKRKLLKTELQILKNLWKVLILRILRKKTQNLVQASMKLGEAVYKSQQKPDPKTQNKNDSKSNENDNVVDADFEDIKEKKEEDKEKSA